MSKVRTVTGKKKGRKKKSLDNVSASPDLLDHVLPEDHDKERSPFEDLELNTFQPKEQIAFHKEEVSNNEGEPMFPHELHMALRNQIQGLEEEKEELMTRLKQSEEMQALPSPLRNLGRSSELAANRIMALGKKVKELQAQIKQQDQVAKKIEQVDFPVSGGGDKGSDLVDSFGTPTPMCSCGQIQISNIKPRTDSVEDYVEKLNSANAKLCELRNQNQYLRHEHKMALKALSSELGEKVNIPSILSGGQGWRGRAQQIISQQQRILELTEKLAAAQADTDISECIAKREKNRADLDSLRTEIETLRTEADTLRLELTEVKKKLDESRTRIRSLTTEMSAMRAANGAMVEKLDASKKTVENLNFQLGAINEKTKGKEHGLIIKFEQLINNLKKDLAQEKLRNDQLHEVLKEKETTISLLHAKTSTIIHSHSQGELVETTETMRIAPSRSSSLDKECSSSNITNEAERVRLMELVGVNSRRLQDERKNSTALEEQLRSERHRSVRLETKLARLELERVGWLKGLYRKQPAAEPSYRADNEWDTLKDKAELLEEKCLALESRLKTLQQEKEEDNRRFIQIIEEQRSSILDLQRKENLS